MNPRIGCYTFPCGLSYCDKHTEVNHDYKRLAFLPFATLKLEVDKGCPPLLLKEIEQDVKQYHAGQTLQVSATGQTVILGQ